jgi:hypothetical protein
MLGAGRKIRSKRYAFGIHQLISFFATSTDSIMQLIFTLDGSNNAVFSKTGPFGGLINKQLFEGRQKFQWVENFFKKSRITFEQ